MGQITIFVLGIGLTIGFASGMLAYDWIRQHIRNFRRDDSSFKSSPSILLLTMILAITIDKGILDIVNRVLQVDNFTFYIFLTMSLLIVLFSTYIAVRIESRAMPNNYIFKSSILFILNGVINSLMYAVGLYLLAFEEHNYLDLEITDYASILLGIGSLLATFLIASLQLKDDNTEY